MGAVEHLKSLCCLGLPPESAMVAVVPVLHEIIPHGTMRVGLIAPDATITSVYTETSDLEALYRERMWRFMDDQSALCSLWVPMFLNVANRLDDAPAGRGLPGNWLFPGNRSAA